MYRWVEHTSEVELAVRADSAEEVFAESMRALGELLGADGDEEGERLHREIDVEASDRAGLLAAWLEELIFLAETEGFLPLELSGIELADRRLAATVEGRRGAPSALVKAVTYHRLALEPVEGGWTATVVLDV